MIRIKSAQVSLMHAALAQPFRIATGAHQSLENVLLTLTLTDGTKGYGEAAVATHITGETIPTTVKNLKIAATYLRGQKIGDYLSCSAYVHSLFHQNMAVVAAVEMALLDALTKHLQMPLWRMWGRSIKPFTTDITIVIGSLEEAQTNAKKFYAQGFRAFKIKIGQDMDLDFKRVMAVVGITCGSRIILDANQGCTAQETLKFLRLLSQKRIRIDLIEQPVAKGDWEGLKHVTRQSKVLVCADESVSNLNDAIYAIKEKSVGAINIKLMKTGIQHSIAIAQLARAHGIKLMIGGMMESPLAMTASAHLAAGFGCFDFVDLDTPFFIKDGLKKHPCLNQRGIYDLRKIKTGIGITP